MAVQKKPLEIRLFTKQDAQTLWDLRMLALETDPWSFVDSPEELHAISVEQFATRLRADLAENFIVGVFVKPAARGRGIARSLMQAAIERAKAIDGLDMVMLTVSVDQPAPRKLYESLGFRSIGVEPRGIKIGNQAHDEEHMVLEFSK
jgi:ribosomal protein S18 acetylase RimI-like enzyme